EICLCYMISPRERNIYAGAIRRIILLEKIGERGEKTTDEIRRHSRHSSYRIDGTFGRSSGQSLRCIYTHKVDLRLGLVSEITLVYAVDIFVYGLLFELRPIFQR